MHALPLRIVNNDGHVLVECTVCEYKRRLIHGNRFASNNGDTINDMVNHTFNDHPGESIDINS